MPRFQALQSFSFILESQESRGKPSPTKQLRFRWVILFNFWALRLKTWLGGDVWQNHETLGQPPTFISRLRSVFPVVWLSIESCYGDNQNLFISFLKNDSHFPYLFSIRS